MARWVSSLINEPGVPVCPAYLEDFSLVVGMASILVFTVLPSPGYKTQLHVGEVRISARFQFNYVDFHLPILASQLVRVAPAS